MTLVNFGYYNHWDFPIWMKKQKYIHDKSRIGECMTKSLRLHNVLEGYLQTKEKGKHIRKE